MTCIRKTQLMKLYTYSVNLMFGNIISESGFPLLL